MSIFDKYLLKKDTLLRRRIEIDKTLYGELEKLAIEYDTSINNLVNIAIIELIKNENIQLYKRAPNETVIPHGFSIRETSYKKLEEYKDEYGISIYKLINIAIYNALYRSE